MHRPKPDMPSELVYALRVNVTDLRPWEYDGMEADHYETIVYCQNVFHREIKYAREDRAAQEKAKAEAKKSTQRPTK